jgi:endonuclease/exonuclease/phosphatase family metal-dependent hydrolase
MKPLRFLTWNLNGAAGDRAHRLVELLAAEVTDGPSIAALQEVKPATFQAIEESGVFDWLVHSLQLRAPGEFDRGNRKLGCVVAGRGEVDHPDEARSEFWWPAHEPLVLGPRSDRQHDLEDAYRLWLAENPDEFNAIVTERPDGPLAITHLRGAKEIRCRYDQVWVSPEWHVERLRHLTEESFKAGSDHALVATELRLRP